MSDHVVELPAPVMSEDAFHRRREHLLAEIQRPRIRRRHALAAVLVTAVLARNGLRSDQRGEPRASRRNRPRKPVVLDRTTA